MKSNDAKRAETFYENICGIIRRNGIERIGLFTITFPDNVQDSTEAQRRTNSFFTNVVRPEINEYAGVYERQASGRIHFHYIVAFLYDIRDGFDLVTFERMLGAKRCGDIQLVRKYEKIVFASCNNELKSFWHLVRKAAPRYRVGRCETYPVYTTPRQVARYLANYLTGRNGVREQRDAGVRLVRYGCNVRSATIKWDWAFGAGVNFRRGKECLGKILSIGGIDEFHQRLGRRWAYYWREIIELLAKNYCEAQVVIKECNERKYTIKQRLWVLSRTLAQNGVVANGRVEQVLTGKNK